VTQIEDNVRDYIESELTEYEDILVTSEPYTGDVPTFPVVYVHEMSQREVGEDLDGSNIVAVDTTFQIEVATSTKPLCKDISTKVMMLMKELRFKVIASPLYQEGNGYSKSVSRYERVVGGEDGDLVDKYSE
jgi:hypothetical protein